MSAFSRGILASQLTFLGPRHLATTAGSNLLSRTPLQTLLLRTTRPLHQLAPLRAAAHTQPKPIPATTLRAAPRAGTPRRSPTTPAPAARPPPIASAGATAPSNYAFVQQLVQKGAPTLLYEAPSHFWLMAAAWSAGVFCWAYAGYNSYINYLYPPPGLDWWVPHAFGVICAFMAGMGMYFVIGATGIIKSIRAIPVAASTITKATVVGPVAKTPQLNLEFKIKRPLPFMQPKTIVVPAEAVTMKTHIFKPVLYVSEQQRQIQERKDRKASQARWAEDKERLLTLPFRQAARGVSGAFAGIKRALTREGFLKVNVKGSKYKLDITSGWALEDGKAIDRIIRRDSA